MPRLTKTEVVWPLFYLSNLQIVFALGVLGLVTGCTTYIVPPAPTPDSVSVWVVDYGRHASLILPEGSRGVEYEYGEWKWFALGQNQSPRVIPTLFWPTQGTLGRRHRNYAITRQSIQEHNTVEALIEIPAPKEKVLAVKRRLELLYSAGARSEIYNAEYDLYFVKVPEPYDAFHNCNHELAQWLRDLGCHVEGPSLFAKFKLRSK